MRELFKQWVTLWTFLTWEPQQCNHRSPFLPLLSFLEDRQEPECVSELGCISGIFLNFLTIVLVLLPPSRVRIIYSCLLVVSNNINWGPATSVVDALPDDHLQPLIRKNSGPLWMRSEPMHPANLWHVPAHAAGSPQMGCNRPRQGY